MYDESKEESKGETSNTPIIELVQEYCMATQFENEFEKFAADNFDIFADATEMKDSSEHRLEFYDIYQQYLHKFERKIEDFIYSKGYEPKQFYAEARTLLENDDDFTAERFFVEALLATSEYDSFFRLMVGEMRDLKKKGRK